MNQIVNGSDCKACYAALPDLLFDPEVAQPAARAHLLACAECRKEFQDLQATMGALDAWTAPEPSAYFDTRVRARVRAAQAEAPESLWERLVATLQFSTGIGRRPMLAGSFALALLLGGGTAATLWSGHHQAPVTSSPTVNDLRVFDNNAQALQQMDLLDEPGSDPATAQPQS